MKRHISIFALLLSAFAAVGPAMAWGETTDLGALFISDKAVAVKVTGLGSGEFTTEKASGKSYYQKEWQWADNSFTAQVPAGYRFDAWYTLENNDNDSDGSGTSPKLCTKRLETGVTISGSAIAANAKTTAAYFDDYVVCPKFIRIYKISTAVSPTGVGTVSVTGGNGDGTVDEGGSVKLTATPNKGYEFSKWSEGDVTENPRTIGNIKADATYTAVFTKKVNAITSGPTIDNWIYGDTPKAPSASAQYTGSTGMTYTYYNSSKTSLGSSPPTNAGTYYIRATSPSSAEYVSATSDYVPFSISKKTINTDNVSFSGKSVTYTGGEQKIEASNIPNGVTVTYENNTLTAVGEQTATAKFTPTDAANCEVTTASKTAKLTITAATITGVTLKSTSVTYDGQSHQPQVASVSANNKTFSTSGTGWTVVYQRNGVETSDFTNAGTITVRVTGTGNLTGSSSAYFTIGTKEIRMDDVVFADLTTTYDGVEKKIVASNVPSGVTATYSSNTRTTAGEQQARVTFGPNDKNHTVSLTQKLATLKIEQATITEVALNGTSATYDGQSHKPTIGWVTANNKTFQNVNTGWDVTYLRNGSATGDFTSPGTITVTATGNTNLKGSKSATFTINKATIESVALATVSATYDGKAHQPVVNSVTASGKGFSSASAGWTVAYTRGGAATTDFTSAGAITVTVTGKTGLSGTASATFTIAKKTISTTGVGFSDKSVTYDGTAKSITASSIPEGVTVTYFNNSRTDAGSQTATVNFEPTDKENCTVSPTSKMATLTVNQATISVIALSATSATYDGQPHQPQVASVTANGKTFTDAAIGWDVTYDKTDFTSVGNIKVTANGKKNLTGSANATFEIKSKSITVTFDPNGGNAPSQASKTVQYPGTYGTLPTCTRKGYDFTGWWTAKEGGTEIMSATSVGSDASQTLFAHWEARKYTLTIALKEGESYGTYKGPQSYQLPDPLIFGETNLNEIAVAYKKDDADFQGYFTSAGAMVYDAQGRNVMGALGEYWTNNYPIGTYCYDGNLTLSARFADPREHYQVTVTASPEGAGTVDPSGTATYVEGSNIVLMATENTGYSFWHWTKDGAEVSTDREHSLTVTENAEYTAVFTGNVYTVSLKNAVLVGTPTKTVVYGEPYGEFQTFENPGMYITGWYYTDDYRPEDLVCATTRVLKAENHKLYALWEEIKEFTVTFADPEGGHDPIPEPRTKGQSIGEPAKGTENWKRDGYWRDNSSDWNPSLETIVTDNMTVNAKWTSIADMLDCSNLVFNSTGNWRPYYEDLTAVNKNCMRLESSENMGDPALSTVITNDGTMTFSWKAGVVGVNLRVRVDDGQFTNFTAKVANVWQTETMSVPLSGKAKCGLAFHLFSTDIEASWCVLDHVIWTDNPTYTVTYSWDKETQTDTKKQGVPLTLKLASFTRTGYEQDGWSKNPDGSVKDFELGGTYLDDDDLTLYPTWKESKPVIIDEIARALDCENSGLTFVKEGGWSVITNQSFAKKGDSYLSDLPDEAKLKTTIPQSGTLTFWWKAPIAGGKESEIIRVETNGQLAISCKFEEKKEEWKPETLYIDASQGAVELTFESACDFDDNYRALDFFTWTPEGGGEPTPGDPVKPTAVGVANGVFSLTIPTEIGKDYGVWTNADLTVDSWGLMGNPQKGDGNPWKVDWTILPGFPQLFFRAHTVEWK